MIIVKAPHRITFSGGGTDFPDYFKTNSSLIVGCAINRFATVVIAKPESDIKHKYRLSYSRTEEVESLSEIEHPIIKAALSELNINFPLHINSISDVPASTGLGTSSSFTVALLAGLNRLIGKDVSQSYIAQQAIYVERDLARLDGGHQDQWWAALGGFRFLKFDAVDTTSEAIKDEGLVEYINKNSYLIGLNETRSSADASKTLINNIKTGETLSLNEMRDLSLSLLDELKDTQISANKKLISIKKTMQKTWEHKKSNITRSEKLQELEQNVAKIGAIMKLCGGGYTGYVYLIADQEQTQALQRLGYKLSKVQIDFTGVEVIHE